MTYSLDLTWESRVISVSYDGETLVDIKEPNIWHIGLVREVVDAFHILDIKPKEAVKCFERLGQKYGANIPVTVIKRFETE